MTHSTILGRTGLISVLALVAACDSTSTATVNRTLGDADQADVPSLEDVNISTVFANGDIARINAIPGTKFERIPTAGSATFTGPGQVDVFAVSGTAAAPVRTDVVNMLGLATVTYDFAEDEFTGRIRDLVATNAADEVGLVDGIIIIENGGQADEVARPTLLEADATGAVAAFGTTYDVTVGLEGLLRGTNPGADIPVQALTLEGENGTVAGSTLLVDVSVAGDKDAASNGSYVNDLTR